MYIFQGLRAGVLLSRRKPRRDHCSLHTVGPLLEVDAADVDVEVDLLPEAPVAHVAGEGALLVVHQPLVLVQHRLVGADVVADAAVEGLLVVVHRSDVGLL